MKAISKISFLLFFTMSCGVSQSDYDILKKENENILSEKNKLQIEYNRLLSQKEQFQEKKKLDSMYTEEYALKLLADYYDFYYGSMVYRNPRVRKNSYNEFVISLEECIKKFSHDEFFWHAKVKILTIYENGKYEIKNE